jgi:hypothetical protein
MKAEELLKQKGHYYPMPKPFTKGDVIKSMEEYSSLQIKEVIEEIEGKKIMSDDSEEGKKIRLGIKLCISILNSKLNGNKH